MAGGNGFQVEAGALSTYQTRVGPLQQQLESAVKTNKLTTLDLGQQTFSDMVGAAQLAAAYITFVETYIGGGGAASGSATGRTGVPLVAGQIGELTTIASKADQLYQGTSASEAGAAQVVDQMMTSQTPNTGTGVA